MPSARDEILERVRASLGRPAGAPPPSIPGTTRVGPRAAGEREAELELLCGEIRKLSGVATRLAGREALAVALTELVRAEGVKKATLWSTPELVAWGVEANLRSLGVEIVSPQADKRLVAACELGVTGVDAALPETGTLALTSSPERPRVVSLLPRVHLALLTPSALRADLHQVFAEAKPADYMVLVTGPSRTADIELTLTLGVHGPKALYAWVLEGV